MWIRDISTNKSDSWRIRIQKKMIQIHHAALNHEIPFIGGRVHGHHLHRAQRSDSHPNRGEVPHGTAEHVESAAHAQWPCRDYHVGQLNVLTNHGRCPIVRWPIADELSKRLWGPKAVNTSAISIQEFVLIEDKKSWCNIAIHSVVISSKRMHRPLHISLLAPSSCHLFNAYPTDK